MCRLSKTLTFILILQTISSYPHLITEIPKLLSSKTTQEPLLKFLIKIDNLFDPQLFEVIDSYLKTSELVYKDLQIPQIQVCDNQTLVQPSTIVIEKGDSPYPIICKNVFSTFFHLKVSESHLATALIMLKSIILQTNSDISYKLSHTRSLAYVCGDTMFYEPITSTCQNCPSMCLECQTKVTCDTCFNGYYFDSILISCVKCPNYCSSCQSNTDCTACLPYSYLSPENMCVACIANCQACSNSYSCDSCSLTMYYNSGLGMCVSCPSNCESCSNSNLCFQCSGGFYLTAISTCEKCSNNCLDCVSSTNCSNCNSTYFLTQMGSCQSCPSKCSSCSQVGTCELCFDGFFLNAYGQCVACPSFCSICNTTQKCDECESTYFLSLSYQCLPCPEFCIACTNINTCEECMSGYHLSPKNLCVDCDSNCLQCFNKTCSLCTEGYFLNSVGSCDSCLSLCRTCNNANNCESCVQNYYFANNGDCLACSAYCFNCSSSSVCYGCFDGYYLDSGSICRNCPDGCLKCTPNNQCINCESGYFLNNNLLCQTCPNNCDQCDSQGNCLKCDSISSMNQEGLCQPCALFCSNCPQNNNCFYCVNGTCASCLSGFNFTEDGFCMPQLCDGNCLDCENLVCKQCNAGYYLTINFNCEKSCDPFCDTCSNGNCSKCLSGYTLINNACEASCGPFCDTCSNGNCSGCLSGYILKNNTCEKSCDPYCGTCLNGNCSNCLSGYVLLSNFSCAPSTCDSNCVKCSIGKCTQCASGYYLANSGACLGLSCDTNCQVCSKGNCSQCASGFNLVNNSCVTIPCDNNCQNCSKGACSQCVLGFNLVNNFCVTIPCDKNCLVCSKGNCSHCVSGFSLYQNSCVALPCTNFCADCVNGNCLQCITGYYLSSNNSCIPNQCDSNCKLCNNSICSECFDQYFFSQGKCVPCGPFCKTCNSLATCECITDYVMVNNNCVKCTSPHIISSHFNQDFSGIVTIFSTDFTTTSLSNCNFVWSFDALGQGFTCSVFQSQLIISFGKNYFISNTSVIFIDLSQVYLNLCNAQPKTIQFSAYYLNDPESPFASIEGPSVKSIICDASDLQYSASNFKGIYNNIIVCKWSIDISPPNPDVASFVSYQNSTSISIPSSLFNSSLYSLTITLQISNALHENFKTSLFTQISNQEMLNVTADSNYAIINSSQVNFLHAKVTNFCGKSCKPNFFWNYVSSNNPNFDSFPSNFTISNTSTLMIEKNLLFPGFTYNFVVYASCNNIEGNTIVSVETHYSSLVIILDMSDGTISNDQDLFIDGSQSYDPNNVSNFTYNWKCLDNSSNLCNSSDVSLKNFTVPKENLEVGSSLTITLTISASPRSTTKTIQLQVKKSLSTLIRVSSLAKLEPSRLNIIFADIISNSSMNFNCTLLQGNQIIFFETEFPALVIYPNTLLPDSVYTFKIDAYETGLNSSYSQINFITNTYPVCDSPLNVDPKIGSSMNTFFTFSISDCSDPDFDLPLTYLFYVKTQSNIYLICLPSMSNSITTKMFQGNFEAFVSVCDYLLGCTLFNSSLNVTENGSLSRYLSDNVLNNYVLDTNNENLIPIMVIAYLKSNEMILPDIMYIYNDLIKYLGNLYYIDNNSVTIIISVVAEILNQKTQISFENIQNFLKDIDSFIKNLNDSLTSTNLEFFLNLTQKILNYESSSVMIVQLINNCLIEVLDKYSENYYPNTIISDSNLNYFVLKSRFLESDLNNNKFQISPNSNITFGNLNYVENSIINVVLSMYPQTNSSDLISFNITSSGNYSGNKIVIVPEETISSNEFSIELSISLNNNQNLQTLGCFVFDSGNFNQNNLCTIISNQKNSVTVKITGNIIFTFMNSNQSSNNPGPLGLLILVLIFSLIGFKNCKFNEPDLNQRLNSINFCRNCLKHYLDILLNSENPQRILKLLIIMMSLFLNVFIEGLFIYLGRYLFYGVSNLFVIGLISSSITLIIFNALSFCTTHFDNQNKWYDAVFAILMVLNFCPSVFFLVVLSFAQQLEWMFSFMFSLLVIFLIQGIVLFISYKKLRIQSLKILNENLCKLNNSANESGNQQNLKCSDDGAQGELQPEGEKSIEIIKSGLDGARSAPEQTVEMPPSIDNPGDAN